MNFFKNIFLFCLGKYKMVELTRKEYNLIPKNRGIIEPQKNVHSGVNRYP